MLTSGSSSRSGEGLGRRGRPGDEGRRVGLHLHEPHGALGRSASRRRSRSPCRSRRPRGPGRGRCAPPPGGRSARARAGTRGARTSPASAGAPGTSPTPAAARTTSTPASQAARRRRRRGRGAPAAGGAALGPARRGGQWSRIGASQGRPAYSAKRSATHARRSSRPASLTSTRSARAAFSSSGQLAGAALVEVLAPRLDPPAADVVRRGHEEGGIEPALGARLEQQRHLADQQRRGRPARGLLGRPCPATPLDPGVQQPLEVGDPALLGERPRAEGRPVDLRRRRRGPRGRSARPPRAARRGRRRGRARPDRSTASPRRTPRRPPAPRTCRSRCPRSGRGTGARPAPPRCA